MSVDRANQQVVNIPKEGYIGFNGNTGTPWYIGNNSEGGGFEVSKADEPAFLFKNDGVIARDSGDKVVWNTDPIPTGQLTSNIWDRGLYQIAYRNYDSGENIQLENYTPYSIGVLYAFGSSQFSFMGNLIAPNSSGRTVIHYDYWNSALHFDTNGSVIPLSAPTISTQPSDQSLSENDTLDLSVDFSGNPTPNIQWQYSSDDVTFMDLDGATSKHFIKTAVISDTGYYRAVVTNSQGSATSLTAHIIVNSIATELSLAVNNNLAIEILTSGPYTGKKRYSSADQTNIGGGIMQQTLATNADGFVSVAFDMFNGGQYSQRLILELGSNPAGNNIFDCDFGVYCDGGTVSVVGTTMNSGNPLETIATDLSIYTKLRLKRTTGVMTLEGSSDDTNWTIIYTAMVSLSTAQLYVNIGMEWISGLITDVEGYNFN